MKDAHAEESLIKSGKRITEIEASRPVCLDCKDLMNEKVLKVKLLVLVIKVGKDAT